MWINPTPRGRNHSLDGLRAIAIILTFEVHFFGGYLATFRGGNPDKIPLSDFPGFLDKVMYWLYHSHHGVSIFFLLSGFLISTISQRPRFSYLNFVRNRITRVYPAFFLALIICLAGRPYIGMAFPDARLLIANLFFLNAIPSLGIPGIVLNNVTWSLFYEMVFYLLFPAVLLFGRWANMPAIGSTVIGGIIFAYGPRLFGLDLAPFVFLFAGAVIGCLRRDQIESVADSFPDAAILFIYLAVTSLFTLSYIDASTFTWLFSGAIIVILCKTVSGRGLLARALSWRPLAWLGVISYSFYLLHSVSIVIFFRARRYLMIPGAGDVIDVAILGLISFIAAAGLSYVSYMLVERFYFTKRNPEDPAPSQGNAR
ncbi:acyltransferase family protein [Bradyrhizobium lablabi]|uniref:acyltransferase family protein n=1 Tax=Bradyrhizobium lablabi TaxID=722472 RepID=UPI00090C16D0|nr:acyltransferase [Bradyrhizobium lablabi]SHM79709.1 Peptidoglycan/LPS O-acetylase OafA/YrhL, contains acyltransferase and SGNH-hydrolase domains [Bradyrhizobium lablabi]